MIRKMKARAEIGLPYNPDSDTLQKLAPYLVTTVEWLLEERGPEEVVPDDETIIKGIEDATGKTINKNETNRDVVIQNVKGPVTVVDQTVVGDKNVASVSGNSPTAAPSPDAKDLMGEIITIIAEIYKEAETEIELDELGRVSLERHTAILAACQDPDEFPHAIEIMKLRLRKSLAKNKKTNGEETAPGRAEEDER